MTARINPYGTTLEITSTPGEVPEEVLDNYIAEVEQQGHEVKETDRPRSITPTALGPMRHDRTLICFGCGKTMRVYFIGETLHIFSDFAGHQCTRRQMNILSLMKQ